MEIACQLITLSILCCFALPGSALSAEPSATDFTLGVRTSEPLSPAEELETFSVPNGFRVQLFASEPDIAKPLNMAFDARGRLWVTDTLEYPYPVEVGKPGRDSIKVLEDTDQDGRADSITTFADGLNIPIGLYPYRDGVICYSIPNIWLLRDTDGDGRCDRREILYGPFDHTRDTHGMCNAFTRGYDGWLYACHGFNNQSTVRGADGHEVTMHSGNTFRFQVDGSRIEHFTHGQVNPFGMAFDGRGDLFNADCHTKPVTLLLHGGYYESFGKPHDGLGFVPSLMEHLHGSTAISGLAIVPPSSTWPAEFHDNSFGGNVMTSRINRNSLQYTGSSVRAVKADDFLISDDPWFRPVDLQLGPNCALFIADFYNRIIGHYEVPLDHPGRDRQRGRIWKVTYTGDLAQTNLASSDLAVADLAGSRRTRSDRANQNTHQLLSQIRSQSPHQRMWALDQLADTARPIQVAAVRQALGSDSDQVRLHCLWVLARRGLLSSAELHAATRDSSSLVRRHAQDILGSDLLSHNVSHNLRCQWIAAGLQDPAAVVRRAAATACLAVQDPLLANSLIDCARSVPKDDIHLRHAIRIGLKHQIDEEKPFKELVSNLDPRDVPRMAEVCLALRHTAAAEFLTSVVATQSLSASDAERYVAHATRYLSVKGVPTFVRAIRRQFADAPNRQYVFLRSLRESLAERGESLPESLTSWASDLAADLLRRTEATVPVAWTDVRHAAVSTASDERPTWGESHRRDAEDGERGVPLWSSFVNGEQRAGVFRSEVFTLAKEFSFYIAGHDGYPHQELQGRNYICIRDAETDELLQTWAPPRQDLAVLREWLPGSHAGKRVYAELVDGDPSKAYAWIAVGRFLDARLNPQRWYQDLEQACDLIGGFQTTGLIPQLEQRLTQLADRPSLRHRIASTLTKVRQDPLALSVAESLRLVRLPAPVVSQGIDLLTGSDKSDRSVAEAYFAAALPYAVSVEQQRIAQRLASSPAGIDVLLKLARGQTVQPQLFARPAIRTALTTAALPKQRREVEEILKDLPEELASIGEAIRDYRAAYSLSGGDREAGQRIFQKQCSVCHQVANRGKTVGPNLDGIGNRGLERLTEDVLAPNRNIDIAFRASTIVTVDGLTKTGLLRTGRDGLFTLIDFGGEEQTFRKVNLEHIGVTKLSPMPANFSDVLSVKEFCDLMSYLLSLREP